MFKIGDRVRLINVSSFTGATGTLTSLWMTHPFEGQGFKFKPDPEFLHISFTNDTWDFYDHSMELIDTLSTLDSYSELFYV